MFVLIFIFFFFSILEDTRPSEVVIFFFINTDIGVILVDLYNPLIHTEKKHYNNNHIKQTDRVYRLQIDDKKKKIIPIDFRFKRTECGNSFTSDRKTEHSCNTFLVLAFVDRFRGEIQGVYISSKTA